ncbi:MAG: hypothetical protein FJ298_13460 [Planctomycetes bacterium]|nr:hypothetical protein [Planctomycetota bacterium]
MLSGLGIHGVIGASVFTGGALALALGRTRQGLEAAQARSAQDASANLLLEQLATDLAQTRAMLEVVQAQAAENTCCVQALRVEVANASSASESAGSSTQALFQLASGLDKLGARIDQRLDVHHAAMQDSLEELGATLAHTRRTLEERLAALDATRTPPTETTPHTSTTPNAGTNAGTSMGTSGATADDTTLELADGNWNPSDWNAPQVESTEIHGTLSELEQWHEREGAGTLGSLGLLDSFEDPAHSPSLPQAEPTPCEPTRDVTLDFDTLDANSDELARELDRASRAGQHLDAPTAPATNDVDAVPGVADLANKLQTLQALLADPALQALFGQGKPR